MNDSFKNLGLNAELLKAMEAQGFKDPTPIQARAIPLMLQKRDVIGQARTGTGKTIAFAAPIVQLIQPAGFVQALVLTPTRELALQVKKEIEKLGGGLSILTVYGGQSMDMQLRALKKGVDVVVGTPGRILDHLGRKTISLNRVSILVLDEADRMLDMGFIDDVKEILSHTPKTRQTALFSATMPLPVIKLAKDEMKNPETLLVSRDKQTVDEVEQQLIMVPAKKKPQKLAEILKRFNGLALVFCNTKSTCDRIQNHLRRDNINAETLHGNLSQARREQVLQAFREKKVRVLVATDVAARGLDIEGISHVINYHPPKDHKDYVHRVGRTARAGKKGTAITLVTSMKEKKLLDRIANITRSDIEHVNEEKPKQTYHGIVSYRF